ncbi:hypothetical protein [Salipiger sp. PrR003]|uniref:hypothetical protein n=1 Tax=Salipiger sp. PrR003 TaxID=2706776 RepID=UPI001944983E|nr:hypothetical protein [Salipiger sp. PrR003]
MGRRGEVAARTALQPVEHPAESEEDHHQAKAVGQVGHISQFRHQRDENVDGQPDRRPQDRGGKAAQDRIGDSPPLHFGDVGAGRGAVTFGQRDPEQELQAAEIEQDAEDMTVTGQQGEPPRWGLVHHEMGGGADDVRAHRGQPRDRHDGQQGGKVERAACCKGKVARIAPGQDQQRPRQRGEQEQDLGVRAHTTPAHQDVAHDQRDRDSGEQVIVAEQVREGENRPRPAMRPMRSWTGGRGWLDPA